MRKFFLLITISLFSATYAQNFTIKSNLLYDITTTINIGTEFSIAPKWTIDISGNYNPWQFEDNKKLKHWLVQPELRYWMCEKFYGHFIGLHLHYAKYNVGGIELLGLKDYRYEGDLYGGGFSYGYHFLLGKRWGMELSIGIGYARLEYDKYECAKCGDYIDSYKTNYFGPTKASISLIYFIK